MQPVEPESDKLSQFARNRGGDPLWRPCHEGMIAGAVHAVAHRRRRRSMIGAAAVCAGLLCSIGLAWQWIPSAPAPTGQLTCGRVMELIPAYVRGELARPTVTRIDAHVRHCPGCRERLRSVREGRRGQRSSGASVALLAARIMVGPVGPRD